MSQLTTTAPTTTRPGLRTVARWMVSFVGFPLGGLAAMVTVGGVDSTGRALAGGLVTGTVLGIAQALALRSTRRDLLAWALATGLGLAVGLAVGASVVGFGTELSDLVVQGAVSGAAVGAAQAALLARRTGAVAFVWPAYLAAAWSLGWLVTTSVGVQVDEQFTVFGAAGAVTVTLLTAVLPFLVTRPQHV